jgi:hypothetical protein
LPPPTSTIGRPGSICGTPARTALIQRAATIELCEFGLENPKPICDQAVIPSSLISSCTLPRNGPPTVTVLNRPSADTSTAAPVPLPTVTGIEMNSEPSSVAPTSHCGAPLLWSRTVARIHRHATSNVKPSGLVNVNSGAHLVGANSLLNSIVTPATNGPETDTVFV